MTASACGSFWALSKHEWCPSWGIRTLALSDRLFSHLPPELRLLLCLHTCHDPLPCHVWSLSLEVCAQLSSKHKSFHLFHLPVFCTVGEPVPQGRDLPASWLAAWWKGIYYSVPSFRRKEMFHHPNNELSKAQWKRMILTTPSCLAITTCVCWQVPLSAFDPQTMSLAFPNA